MDKKEVEQLLTDYLGGYLEIISKINEEVEYQYEVIDLFITNLKEVDEINYRILVMFYRENQPWEIIADCVILSVSQCRNRRNKLIEELERRLVAVKEVIQ